VKVALVGGSPSYKLAPYADESFEIWAHGNQLDKFEDNRVSRVFEIHDDLSEHPTPYAEWLVKKNIPMVVGKGFPLTGDHIKVFPYDRANALMGQHLTSTPAYMMALAILEGYTEINIFGVEMAVDDHEYFYQRPSMYAWIAYAKAKGITVTIEGGLFKDDYVEGESDGKPDLGLPPFTSSEFGKVAKVHSDAMDNIESEILVLQMKMNAHSGCKQTYERLAKVARGIEAGAVVDNLTDSMVIK